jgi:hypothetical protein
LISCCLQGRCLLVFEGYKRFIIQRNSWNKNVSTLAIVD